MKRTYTVSQAARRLKVSRPAILQAIKEGRLAAKKEPVEKWVWKIPHSSLKAYEVSLSHQVRGKKND